MKLRVRRRTGHCYIEGHRMSHFFRHTARRTLLCPLGAALILIILLSGCSTGVLNARLDQAPADSRYDFQSRLPDNDERLFVVLAFSGGGTRAAALSYGVLDALRNEQLVIDNTPSPLLDQVDVISAVSGGSYTAAYYGLFGERLFEDFEERFLRRNWPRTYGWMLANPFNILCSDLSSYPVANAVMASSSVPPAFAAIRLRNYSGCQARNKPWVEDALETRDLRSRRFAVAQALSPYLEPENMPFLNLADGGITDNIGVRGSMMSPVAHHGNVQQMAGAFSEQALEKVEKVLVILVNAEVYPPYPWSISGKTPGVVDTLMAALDATFSTLTSENITEARREFQEWGAFVSRDRPVGQPPVEVYFTTLTFNQVADPDRQAKFYELPTAALSANEIYTMIAVLAAPAWWRSNKPASTPTRSC
jgi:predicted acylesterase/phospholipase RssA